jgi:hypothetical protein
MENSGGARENGKFLVDLPACGIGSPSGIFLNPYYPFYRHLKEQKTAKNVENRRFWSIKSVSTISHTFPDP